MRLSEMDKQHEAAKMVKGYLSRLAVAQLQGGSFATRHPLSESVWALSQSVLCCRKWHEFASNRVWPLMSGSIPSHCSCSLTDSSLAVANL